MSAWEKVFLVFVAWLIFNGVVVYLLDRAGQRRHKMREDEIRQLLHGYRSGTVTPLGGRRPPTD